MEGFPHCLDKAPCRRSGEKSRVGLDWLLPSWTRGAIGKGSSTIYAVEAAAWRGVYVSGVVVHTTFKEPYPVSQLIVLSRGYIIRPLYHRNHKLPPITRFQKH